MCCQLFQFDFLFVTDYFFSFHHLFKHRGRYASLVNFNKSSLLCRLVSQGLHFICYMYFNCCLIWCNMWAQEWMKVMPARQVWQDRGWQVCAWLVITAGKNAVITGSSQTTTVVTNCHKLKISAKSCNDSRFYLFNVIVRPFKHYLSL